MLQFLSPIWIFASAAVAVPVIIHLLNLRRGKSFKVGSIALFDHNPSNISRTFILSDLFLLIVRCLLILLIALLLAKPVWKTGQIQSMQKGWLLVEQHKSAEAYKNFQPLIDSLVSKDYELHFFEKGFANTTIEEIKNGNEPGDSLKSSWQLFRTLDQQAPAGLPIYIVTANRLGRFVGERPFTNRRVVWKTFIPSDSIARWTAAKYLSYSGKLITKMGYSGPRYTAYEKSNSDDVSNVTIDTSTLKITLYTDEYPGDAAYLYAAIDAIRQYTQRKIEVEVAHQENQIPRSQDWLFWLSSRPMAGSFNTPNIFLYDSGKQRKTDTWIITHWQAEPIKLFQKFEYSVTNVPTENIWEDGFGNSVLRKVKREGVGYYHFSSRFDPSWNELVWKDEFPALMLALILKDDDLKNEIQDRRAIDEAQIQPLRIEGTKSAAYQIQPITAELGSYLWLIIFAVFALERYLSHHSVKMKSND